MHESINPNPKQPEQQKKSLEEIREEILSKESLSYVMGFCTKLLYRVDNGKYVDRAEELGNAVIFQAYKEASQYRGESALKTWMGAIAINTFKMFVREMKTKKNIPVESGVQLYDKDDKADKSFELKDEGMDPLERVIANEQFNIIRAAMKKLHPREKQALDVHLNNDGETREEMAAKMGISVATFKSLLYRARLKIAEDIEAKKKNKK